MTTMTWVCFRYWWMLFVTVRVRQYLWGPYQSLPVLLPSRSHRDLLWGRWVITQILSICSWVSWTWHSKDVLDTWDSKCFGIVIFLLTLLLIQWLDFGFKMMIFKVMIHEYVNFVYWILTSVLRVLPVVVLTNEPSPCLHDRRQYASGDTWSQDCRACSCQDGHVTCHEVSLIPARTRRNNNVIITSKRRRVPAGMINFHLISFMTTKACFLLDIAEQCRLFGTKPLPQPVLNC